MTPFADKVSRGLICANKQSQVQAGQMPCLHEQRTLPASDEQRERGRRSLSSLLIRRVRKEKFPNEQRIGKNL